MTDVIEKTESVASFEHLTPYERTHSLDLAWNNTEPIYGKEYDLRKLGVNWVNERYDVWLSESVAKAKQKTIKRFGLENKPIEYNTLVYSRTSSPSDMPPANTDIAIIALGPSLIIRRGFILDAKSTSYASALSFRVVVNTEMLPSENEFNYSDIIGVDYERRYYKGPGPRPLSDGNFVLRLADGTSWEFRFNETGIRKVLEAIRERIASLDEKDTVSKNAFGNNIRYK